MASQSDDIESYHRSFLPVTTAAAEEPRFLRSYRNVTSGFAARLSEEEMQNLRGKSGFISAQKERILRPQTTHLPMFLGLHPETGFWKQSNFGKGMIIGVLDTGVNTWSLIIFRRRYATYTC
ncbi:hypothetical protein Leryth_000720 [Lithospermum erythrorhizon]|nr:hypothetical protein Leryth_000720 [Lithospermum erythrorhizon]